MSSRGAFFMGSRLRLTPFLRLFRFARCRRLGAPGFREANSAARLGQIFSELASKGIELSAVNVVAPQLTNHQGSTNRTGCCTSKDTFQASRPNWTLIFSIKRWMGGGGSLGCRSCPQPQQRNRSVQAERPEHRLTTSKLPRSVAAAEVYASMAESERRFISLLALIRS
jgi:hypothetical protein